MACGKFGSDGLHFAARGEFGLLEVGFVDLAVGEIAHAVADAAHVQAFQLVRLHAVADDEFGGAAADIHHQPFAFRLRQAVCDAEIDEARFFAPGDDVDGKAERRFGLLQKFGSILGDTQGVGADRAHRLARQAAQAFAEALQAGQCALLRGFVEALVFGQAGGQAHRFAQAIQHVELVILHTGDLQAKTVGAEIDCSEDGLLLHGNRIIR